MFTKGESVHLITTWNNKGKFAIYPLTVHSCGAKRMVLATHSGETFKGNNFAPREIQGAFTNGTVTSIVLAGLTDEQAEWKARELAAAYRAAKVASLHEAIAHHVARGTASPEYVRSMRESAAEVEADEVGFVWRRDVSI